eukprot:GHVS01000957.1.p1 GENE.GHVS01000957.1~~GHVS01000957.1.p1  ORF type:complete len:106 (+),score=2.54 GHVS01000957.1:186-503(+)
MVYIHITQGLCPSEVCRIHSANPVQSLCMEGIAPNPAMHLQKLGCRYLWQILQKLIQNYKSSNTLADCRKSLAPAGTTRPSCPPITISSPSVISSYMICPMLAVL